MASSQVVIRRGNLFDGAKDLIVIPCNTSGGVTRFVLDALLQHKLFFEPRSLSLGAVHYERLDAAAHLAQFAAFAASVQRGTSRATSGALREIGKSLGAFATETPTVRLVSAPLLGTGYGGLAPEVSVQALSEGFRETSPAAATLCLNIIDPTAYDMVIRCFQPKPLSAIRTRRVFISYTRSNTEHCNWVTQLATELRGSGVEARLDAWHLRPGMDLPQWMCTELSIADKVVIVADEAYAERADGRLGGVGWETMVIQGDMSKLPPDNTKYLVVVRASSLERAVPLYLRTKFALHCPPSQDIRQLVSQLVKEINEDYHIPEVAQPLLSLE